MTRATLPILAVLAASSRASCGHPPVIVEHDVVASSGARAEIVVAEQPPAPHEEAVPAAPSPDHLWAEGYWTRCYNGWVWMPGCHVVRPRVSAVWIPGYWEPHPRGWVWIWGRWV